jgi:hypothetical protein
MNDFSKATSIDIHYGSYYIWKTGDIYLYIYRKPGTVVLLKKSPDYEKKRAASYNTHSPNIQMLFSN